MDTLKLQENVADFSNPIFFLAHMLPRSLSFFFHDSVNSTNHMESDLVDSDLGYYHLWTDGEATTDGDPVNFGYSP